MRKRQKFCVYLAGPIHGCNDNQVHRWRDDVVRKYDSHLSFSNPAERLLDQSAAPYEIVEADLSAIDNADGLLVNMWRESIGSAIGVVHAHRAGKPVVVADPNHLNSRMLDFYADAVEETPLKAANVLLGLLRAEADWSVIKSTERREEAFDRRKLMAAIRAACRAARLDDIVVPRLVMPSVIERLKKSDRQLKKRLTTTEIDRQVMATFADMEADPRHAAAVEGISMKWKSRQEEKRPARNRVPRRVTTSSSVNHVEISCGGKSHGTIWGKTVKKLGDIPSADARQVFLTIWKVSGITRITLGPFGRKGIRSSCGATVGESKTPCVIEGKLFDKGDKGTMQSFQVHVHSIADESELLGEIVDRLKNSGRWAG